MTLAISSSGRSHAGITPSKVLPLTMTLPFEAAGDGLDGADLAAVRKWTGQRRESVGTPCAVGLVAGRAIVGEDAPPALISLGLVFGDGRGRRRLFGDAGARALRQVDHIASLAGIDEPSARRR